MQYAFGTAVLKHLKDVSVSDHQLLQTIPNHLGQSQLISRKLKLCLFCNVNAPHHTSQRPGPSISQTKDAVRMITVLQLFQPEILTQEECVNNRHLGFSVSMAGVHIQPHGCGSLHTFHGMCITSEVSEGKNTMTSEVFIIIKVSANSYVGTYC